MSIDYDNIIAIAGFHPSLIVEQFCGGSEDEIAQKVKCPSYMFPTSNDTPNVKTGGSVIKITQERFGDKVGDGVLEFPEMMHGYVVRGDLGDEKVKRDVEKAVKASD